MAKQDSCHDYKWSCCPSIQLLFSYTSKHQHQNQSIHTKKYMETFPGKSTYRWSTNKGFKALSFTKKMFLSQPWNTLLTHCIYRGTGMEEFILCCIFIQFHLRPRVCEPSVTMFEIADNCLLYPLRSEYFHNLPEEVLGNLICFTSWAGLSWIILDAGPQTF